MKVLFVLSLALLFSCSNIHLSSSSRPYNCGPVLSQEDIKKSFPTIIDFIGIKSGDTFGEVGASSGYYTVMMSTLLKDVTIYIQDIDTACLNAREFDKVVNYYSKESDLKLRERNMFHFTVGSPDKTNLPNDVFDQIYTNATFHVFQDPDKMVSDMRTKLKRGGVLVVRDGFSTKTKKEFCSDKACGMPLTKVDTLLAVMSRNGFELTESRSDLRGQPAFKFIKK